MANFQAISLSYNRAMSSDGTLVDNKNVAFNCQLFVPCFGISSNRIISYEGNIRLFGIFFDEQIRQIRFVPFCKFLCIFLYAVSRTSVGF